MIVRGTIAPGSALIERSMSEVVGASRSTVRSALQRLAHERFVTVSSIGPRYSRFFIGPLTIDEMRELYYMFGALDGIAARNAAALPQEERLRVAGAARPLARAHLAAGSGDKPQYERIQKLDSQFHNSYVQAAAGPLLLQEYTSLRPHVDRYGIFYASALIRELPSEVYQEHSAIIDAIEAGDPAAAERAAVANWRNASVRFAAVMGEWGERGNWESLGEIRRAIAGH